jgi:tripartite-type tricarboxylate transporter receptor subunit TctC
MGITRRSFVSLASATALAPILPARAAEWPNRTVRVVVPYLAGGITDTVARITARRLTELTGKPFVIENRVGAGGNIAAEAVIRANDDHVLSFTIPGQIVIAPLVQKLSYDPRTQLKPVARVFSSSFVLAVNAELGAKTLQEFVALAKAKPGVYNYGATGAGGVVHLMSEWFKEVAGVDLAHVPYTGSPPLLPDLASNRIQMYVGNYVDLVPLAESGKVRLLGVTAPKRVPHLPDVPAISEVYPTFVMEFWNGYCGPESLSQAAVDKLAGLVRGIVAEPAVVEQFAKLGIDPVNDTPAAFQKELDRSIEIFRATVQAAKISL